MSNYDKKRFHDVKLSKGKLYCWENSDIEINIASVGKTFATVKGLLTTKERIQTDENGNEFIKLGWQTYYAFSKC